MRSGRLREDVGSRFGKDPSFYGCFGADTATFTTPNPDVHRVRRAALNPFFSRMKTLELGEVGCYHGLCIGQLL